jgi:cytochrome c oxidase subunit 2
MIESSDVLNLMKIVFSIYIALVFSLIGIYALIITDKNQMRPRIKVSFYGWIGFLIFAGVGIHVLTFNKIPWVKWDLNSEKDNVDKEFNVQISDYKFHLPQEQMVIQKGDKVRFVLESNDYTYGFGLFRKNGTMVFQMQVVPGHKNNLVWKFEKPDIYSIRSTEYSGPKGSALLVENAVVISESRSYAGIRGI